MTFAGERAEGDPFAHIIMAQALGQALEAAARERGIILAKASVTATQAAKGHVAVTLSDGTNLSCRLVVAADGARSRLRDEAGLGWVARDYTQSGIVATIGHERSHQGRATEHFLPGGPFAMLPLPDDAAGQHRSSIVWSEPKDNAAALLALPAADFLREVEIRFGLELEELTPIFASTEFKAFAGAGSIKGILVPGAATEYGRNQLDKLTDRAKSLGAKGLVWLKVTAASEGVGFDSPVAKFLSVDEAAAVRSTMSAEDGDLILIVADEWMTTCEVLGTLRNDIARPPVHEGPYRYVWVVEFPLFVGVDKESGHPKSGHHPFTTPHPDDVDKIESDPLSVRSIAYDLVLNGWELGSGSIRIHEPELQRRVFHALGISDDEAERKFGFFLNPFDYGAPPHGGFAFGLDRLVAILAGEENIREVIAFPKTQSGQDPMTNSPIPGDPKAMAELGLKVLPPAT